jgi:hypothetical protein
MRPNTVLAERTGELGGVKHAMSFDENSVAHLMSVLTDLYSDPELAVIREYSTNALDSHIAAGVDRPIEITLPNGLSPFFKIRDYGTGMDASDIETIYSKYGASTKRESDTQVGMLGLGCKSALTYTQQFTLVAVKNGVKSHVAISRTENGSGVMEVIDETITDESNGVTVVIPVKYGNSFEHKCREFFKFWEPGNVLVNGEEPDYVTGRKIGDNITLTRNAVDVIVMGNVPYKVANGYSLFEGRNYRNNFGVVARIEIGEVNFTPSRESLHYTNLTIETIKRIKDEVKVGLNGAIQEDIDASESHSDAAGKYLEWQSILGTGYLGYMPVGIHYKGELIPSTIDGDFISYMPNNSRYSVNSHQSPQLSRLIDSPIIHGFEHTVIASHYREKIRKWLETIGKSNQHMVYLCDNPDDLSWLKWVKNEHVVEWETVRNIKLERQRTPREEIQYDTFSNLKYARLALKDFPKDAKIVLTTPKERPSSVFLKNLEEISKDVILVLIQNHRHQKFIRENPGAVTIREFLKDGYQKLIDSLSEDDLMTLNMDYSSRNALPLLDEGLVNDPGMKIAISASKGLNKNDNIRMYGYFITLSKELSNFWLETAREVSYINKYPLLSSLMRDSKMIEHAYIYVNAVYAAKSKESDDN